MANHTGIDPKSQSMSSQEFFDHSMGISTTMTTLSSLLKLCKDPTENLEDIIAAISGCPPLAANILEQASVGTSGATSVQQAVFNMGMWNLKSAMATAAVRRLFNGQDETGPIRDQLWQHSLATAIFSRLLVCQHSTFLDPEDAFVAGILHDLGKAVLLERFPDQYTEVLNETCSDGSQLLEIEKESFGLTHPKVGAMLAKKWQFPGKIVASISLHHQTLSLDSLSGLVGLANVFATVQGFNTHAAADHEKSLIEVLGWEDEAGMLVKLLEEQEARFKKGDDFRSRYNQLDMILEAQNAGPVKHKITESESQRALRHEQEFVLD